MEDENVPLPQGIEAYQLVLAIAAPLFGIAMTLGIYLWCRSRRAELRRVVDLNRMDLMLEELKFNTEGAAVMNKALTQGVGRLSDLEMELRVRLGPHGEHQAHPSYRSVSNPETQRKLAFPSAYHPKKEIPVTPISSHNHASLARSNSRPLSYPCPEFVPKNSISNTHGTQGTLPHSARGLEYLPRLHEKPGCQNVNHAEDTFLSMFDRPSTIVEESPGQVSPFVSPDDDSAHGSVPQTPTPVNSGPKEKEMSQKPRVLFPSTVQSPNADQVLSVSMSSKRDLIKPFNVSMQNRNEGARASTNSQFVPLRANPSHPDLVPPPLAVIKRNSLRESSTHDQDDNMFDTKVPRRSMTNPVAAKHFLRQRGIIGTTGNEKGNYSHQTIGAVMEGNSGMMTPPPSANGSTNSNQQPEKRSSTNGGMTYNSDGIGIYKNFKQAGNRQSFSSTGSSPTRTTPAPLSKIPLSTRPLPAPAVEYRKPEQSTPTDSISKNKETPTSGKKLSHRPARSSNLFTSTANKRHIPLPVVLSSHARAASMDPTSPFTVFPADGKMKSQLPPSSASSQALPRALSTGSLSSDNEKKKTHKPHQRAGKEVVESPSKLRHLEQAQLLKDMSATLRLVEQEDSQLM